MLLLLYQRAEKLLVHKPLNSLLSKKPEGQCSCSAIHSELCDIIILPRIMMREATVYHNFVRQMSCQSSSFSACFPHASDNRTAGHTPTFKLYVPTSIHSQTCCKMGGPFPLWRPQSNLYTSGTSTGYLSMQCAQGECFDGLIVQRDCQTALLHLNPLPKAICQTRLPFLTRPLASVYANSYQIDDEDVFPNRYSVIRDASQCFSVSTRFFCSSSMTARPPAWMQKWSKASLKSGM